MRATLLVDGHVHIYPHYDLLQTFEAGINSFTSFGKELFNSNGIETFVWIWLLAERSDCNFLKQAIKSQNEFKNNGFKFLPATEKETIIVEQAGKPIIYIIAGRQIVTKERLEVLSLASVLFLKDREKSIDDVIRSIIDSNGIAVLNWAPGKWFFSRGKIVKRILEEYSSSNLVIGDTSLRTVLWPMPKLMTTAQKRGFKIIAGSDPLPFNGEEKYVGSYGFSLKGIFDPNRPADSIRSLIRDPQVKVSFIGKRNNFISFCRRQYKIMAQNYKNK